jgi:hypothetical protein
MFGGVMPNAVPSISAEGIPTKTRAELGPTYTRASAPSVRVSSGGFGREVGSGVGGGPFRIGAGRFSSLVTIGRRGGSPPNYDLIAGQ